MMASTTTTSGSSSSLGTTNNTTTTTTTSSSSSSSTISKARKKRWEGVHMTPDLQTLVETCYRLSQTIPNDGPDDDDNNKEGTTGLSWEQAKSILSDHLQNVEVVNNNSSNNNADKTNIIVSIQVLRAMATILQRTTRQSSATFKDRIDQDISLPSMFSLEQALQSAELMYTPPPDTSSTSMTEEQKRYARRMERLRLQCEERSYRKLTANMDHGIRDDDITAKSMTYAASVGLNMIVAPLSFGCFAYFFAGQVFHWLSPNADSVPQHGRSTTTPDIRRVIAGVVGGVAMLFIEMILFVIRTHELEKSVRQKEQRKRSHATGSSNSTTTTLFGQSALERSYQDPKPVVVPTKKALRKSKGKLEMTTLQRKQQ